MKGKLEGTHVDSIFYNGHTNEPNWEFPSENLEALGPDPLRHAVQWAHQNGLEFTYSIRMNDLHCAVLPGIQRWSRFKRENLHLLQGNVTPEEFEKRVLPWARGEKKEHPLAEIKRQGGRTLRELYSWAAYDYAHSEVRAYFLRVIQGACERYDLDGIELDWGRHPYYFRFGQERQNVPIITDFVRQVRQYLQAYGQKRGRPILLAVRVPDSPALSLSIGLDAETWVGEGWVDVLIAGFGFAPFTFPLAEWVQLAHQREIPVYGCLENLGSFGKKLEVIRATAYRYWEHGVDGIYIYNHIYKGLDEIGDPKELERLNKLYRIDPSRTGSMQLAASRSEPGGKNASMNSSCWPGQLPLAFTTQSGPMKARVSLEIVDQPETASRVTVQTQWKPTVDANRVTWRVNGESFSNPTPFSPQGEDREGWSQFETGALQKGVNQFEVTLAPPPDGNPAEHLVLQELRVPITYA